VYICNGTSAVGYHVIIKAFYLEEILGEFRKLTGARHAGRVDHEGVSTSV